MNVMETLPAYETWSYSKWIAEATEAYFKDPNVQRRFEEWRKKEFDINDH